MRLLVIRLVLFLFLLTSFKSTAQVRGYSVCGTTVQSASGEEGGEAQTLIDSTNPAIQGTPGEQRLWTYFFAGGLVMSAVSVLLILQSYRSKSIVNELLIRRNKEISLQKDHLEEMQEFKMHLLTIVSHDIRAPLRSLKGAVYLSNQGSLSGEEALRILTNISGSLNNITAFADELLDWAKDQMQQPEMRPTAFEINPLIADCVQLLKEDAHSKGVKIIHHQHNSPVAFADKAMIKIVMRNLLTNAVKFCTVGDMVEITSVVQFNTIRVSIADTGPGMDSETVNGLFRLGGKSSPGSLNETGSGLGLFFCKNYITLNHGSISASSAKGSGSTFTFTLPRG